MEPNSALSADTRHHLLRSAGWARYAALLSYISIGIGLTQLLIGVLRGDASIVTTMISFLISTAISLVMAINLMHFARLSKESLEQADAHRLEVALSHLKTYFMIMGILFIIALAFLVLGLLIAILVAATA